MHNVLIFKTGHDFDQRSVNFQIPLEAGKKVSLPRINVPIASFCFTFSVNDNTLLLNAKVILWSNMSSFVDLLPCHEHAFTP